jgi:hypothetical protein
VLDASFPLQDCRESSQREDHTMPTHDPGWIAAQRCGSQ